MAIKLKIFIINGDVLKKLDKGDFVRKLDDYQKLAKELTVEKSSCDDGIGVGEASSTFTSLAFVLIGDAENKQTKIERDSVIDSIFLISYTHYY